LTFITHPPPNLPLEGGGAKVKAMGFAP
jgi:hypothetical protein